MVCCRVCEKEISEEVLTCAECKSVACQKCFKKSGGYEDPFTPGYFVCCDIQKLRLLRCKKCSCFAGIRTGKHDPYGAGFVCEKCGFWYCGTCMNRDGAVEFIKGKPNCVLRDVCDAEVLRMSKKRSEHFE